MTKEIYVARDKNGNVWEFSCKPWFDVEDGVFRNNDLGGTYVKVNTFDISLKPLECVKVTIDTLNQSYRIDKVPEREDGYYTATKKPDDISYILELKNDTYYYYPCGREATIDRVVIGTKPIPKECLP